MPDKDGECESAAERETDERLEEGRSPEINEKQPSTNPHEKKTSFGLEGHQQEEHSDEN